jgi:phosphatidate cytidylyltransferase
MRQRAISSIGVVFVGIVPTLLGSPVLTVVVAAIAIGALYELYVAYQRLGARPALRTGSVAIIALVLVAGTDAPFLALMGAMTAYTLLSLAQHLASDDLSGSLLAWALSVTGVMYIGLTMSHFILLRRVHGHVTMHWVSHADNIIGDGRAGLGLAWLLFALLTTWLTDVFAYLVGRKWGKTKLIPLVSPGKTREGAIAGLAAGTITGGVAGYLFGVPAPFWVMLILGAIVSIGAMIGDLCESLIKRQIGFKDMGSLIPGHGGLLDRVDALLLTVPLTYYLARLLDWRGWP